MKKLYAIIEIDKFVIVIMRKVSKLKFELKSGQRIYIKT
jgi:hypothetical protein